MTPHALAVRVPLVAAAGLLLLAVVCSPARAEEPSGSPSPVPSAGATPGPSPTPTDPPVEDTEDPPPSPGALTYSLDEDQFAFLQGAFFVLIVSTLAGVIGSWGRRG